MSSGPELIYNQHIYNYGVCASGGRVGNWMVALPQSSQGVLEQDTDTEYQIAANGCDMGVCDELSLSLVMSRLLSMVCHQCDKCHQIFINNSTARYIFHNPAT